MRRTTRHDARPQQGPLLATGAPGADEQQPRLLDLGRPPICVVELRVAPVDDDVTGIEQRCELTDQGVDGRAGLDHQHHPPGALEVGHQFLDRVVPGNGLSGRRSADELGGRRGGPVEDANRIATAGHVEDQVLPHHGQAHQSDIVLRHFFLVVRGDSSVELTLDPS